MNGYSNNWRRALILLSGLLGLPLFLAGCATTDDPHQGGFVSGIVGLASGGYEKRITEREQRYQDELGEQQRLEAEAESVQQERMRVQADLNQANQRLASLERKLSVVRAEVSRERTATAAEQKLRELNKTETKMAQVQHKLDDARVKGKAAEDLAAQSIEIKSHHRRRD